MRRAWGVPRPGPGPSSKRFARIHALIRYLVSAIVAILTLGAIFFGLSKLVGPGSPADTYIVGKLELLTSPASDKPPEKR